MWIRNFMAILKFEIWMKFSSFYYISQKNLNNTDRHSITLNENLNRQLN